MIVRYKSNIDILYFHYSGERKQAIHMTFTEWPNIWLADADDNIPILPTFAIYGILAINLRKKHGNN